MILNRTNLTTIDMVTVKKEKDMAMEKVNTADMEKVNTVATEKGNTVKVTIVKKIEEGMITMTSTKRDCRWTLTLKECKLARHLNSSMTIFQISSTMNSSASLHLPGRPEFSSSILSVMA